MELNIEYIFILCVLYINDIGDDLMNNHMTFHGMNIRTKIQKLRLKMQVLQKNLPL